MTRDGCLFCGGKPLTIEHVVPNWLGPILPMFGEGEAGGFAVGRVDLANAPDDVQFFTKRRTKRGELKTPFEARRPCVECNTGWMARLEDNVKPWLTSMIKGGHATVPNYAIRAIAAWAIKTATFFRYSDSPPVPTPDVRNHWLFRHKTPPPGSFVFVARFESEHVGSLWMRGEMVERSHGADVDENEVHLTAIRLGDLALFMVEVFSGNEGSLRIPKPWSDVLIPIWPEAHIPLIWPPAPALRDAGFRALIQMFEPPPKRKQGPRKPPKRPR